MPTIHTENGFSVRIFTNDHLPSHVHIFKAEGSCTINLQGENGLPELREYQKMTRKDIKKALEIVFDNQETFLKKWEEIHNKNF